MTYRNDHPYLVQLLWDFPARIDTETIGLWFHLQMSNFIQGPMMFPTKKQVRHQWSWTKNTWTTGLFTRKNVWKKWRDAEFFWLGNTWQTRHTTPPWAPLEACQQGRSFFSDVGSHLFLSWDTEILKFQQLFKRLYKSDKHRSRDDQILLVDPLDFHACQFESNNQLVR